MHAMIFLVTFGILSCGGSLGLLCFNVKDPVYYVLMMFSSLFIGVGAAVAGGLH